MESGGKLFRNNNLTRALTFLPNHSMSCAVVQLIDLFHCPDGYDSRRRRDGRMDGGQQEDRNVEQQFI